MSQPTPADIRHFEHLAYCRICRNNPAYADDVKRANEHFGTVDLGAPRDTPPVVRQSTAPMWIEDELRAVEKGGPEGREARERITDAWYRRNTALIESGATRVQS